MKRYLTSDHGFYVFKIRQMHISSANPVFQKKDLQQKKNVGVYESLVWKGQGDDRAKVCLVVIRKRRCGNGHKLKYKK